MAIIFEIFIRLPSFQEGKTTGRKLISTRLYYMSLTSERVVCWNFKAEATRRKRRNNFRYVVHRESLSKNVRTFLVTWSPSALCSVEKSKVKWNRVVIYRKRRERERERTESQPRFILALSSARFLRVRRFVLLDFSIPPFLFLRLFSRLYSSACFRLESSPPHSMWVRGSVPPFPSVPVDRASN